MTSKGHQASLSVQEYLVLEERSAIRHEYVDGRMFAMTGGTQRHSTLTSNLMHLLRSHLKGSPCRAHSQNLKVRIDEINRVYYPDILVTCAKRDDKSLFAPDPILIVEVLSRSTAEIDRREKALAYKQLPSLAEYLIVDYKRKHVELHQRHADEWVVSHFFNQDKLELTSLEPALTVSLDTIYEDTDLENDNRFQVHEDLAVYITSSFEDDELEADE